MSYALATFCAASSAYTVAISAAVESAQVAKAAMLLRRNGFVHLTGAGLFDQALIERGALTARSDLEMMLARLEAVGISPYDDSFSFSEAVHRSRLRYDMRIDLRRTPPDSPWEELSEKTASLVTPIVSAAGAKQLQLAVDGLLTSLPGADAQRFHTDGTSEHVYNALVPLVDVPDGTGTNSVPASHVDALSLIHI